MTSAPQAAATRHPSLAYVAPFLAFVLAMAVEKALALPPAVGYPLRCAAAIGAILVWSRDVLSWRVSQPAWSILLGLAIAVVWAAPDALFGYRGHWLFSNFLTGQASNTIDPALRQDWLFLAVRTAGSALLVPVLEELFWRAWMMRWLVERDFWKLPLGACTVSSFWLVALLFASEHGPYWEVGLIAGILFNWWMVRTRNLADCILAHAVANAALAAWVMAAGQWQYWL